MSAGAPANPGGGNKRSGGGGSSITLELQIKGAPHRRNCRVQATLDFPGRPAKIELPLQILEPGDTIGSTVNDPSGSPLMIEFIDGRADQLVDLSPYSKADRARVSYSQGGKPTVATSPLPSVTATGPTAKPDRGDDIPTEIVVLLRQITPDDKTCPRDYEIEVHALNAKGDGVGNLALVWELGGNKRRGILTTSNTPHDLGTAWITGADLRLNHKDHGANHAPWQLVVRSTRFPKVAPAVVAVAPPPAPDTKSWWQQLLGN